ncbi:carboxymuconolactone decarboxylase family protein [Streptomyces sp. NPDC001380]|uniref:carboxymuconolactone decarboxylase family protein n=1 Tax=Streptomyces sp. NPDC001380 TaxID=3364566 RepID=UPI0036A6BC01
MTPNPFTDHTPDSAPDGSRRLMEATERHLGRLPAAVARLAESPQLLEGFQRLSGLFEASTLDPLAREVVILTVATRNACHVCVAMHTARLDAMGAGPDLVAALREGRVLDDARLEAVRAFALHVLATAGETDPEELRAFLAHGHTVRNALEVVLGIGAYTLSTLANRMTRAPLDEELAPYAWDGAAA